MGRALPGGVGFAFELATPKKHNIWKKPLCTWYSGFFHCEKIRDSGRGKHHVEDLRHRIPAERSSAASDVVPHSPQTLVLSSTNTTSLGPKAPAAYRTWCLTPRKPLFFRPQAPRLSGQRRRRRTGRGAPSPAIPCFFVRKHHVPRSGWTDAGTDVVLHSPQSLIPSSRGTTSPGPDGPTPALTWCFTPRNPLFLRFLCTKSLVFFGASTLRTWCKDSRKTLFLRFLCTKSLALFGAPTLRTWCKDSRKTLFLRFLCTKSLALFGAPTP